MYDCNEFNNLAGIPMALPAPLTALIESMGLNSVLYLGFDGTPAASVDELMTESFQQRVDLVAINSELLNMQPAMRNALIAKCRDQLSTRYCWNWITNWITIWMTIWITTMTPL